LETNFFVVLFSFLSISVCYVVILRCYCWSFLYFFQLLQYGQNMFYDFPSVYDLATSATEVELRKLGFGYRARYVVECAQQVLVFSISLRPDGQTPQRIYFDHHSWVEQRLHHCDEVARCWYRIVSYLSLSGAPSLTLLLPLISGPDLEVCPDCWVSAEFLHVPISQKGSGSIATLP